MLIIIVNLLYSSYIGQLEAKSINTPSCVLVVAVVCEGTFRESRKIISQSFEYIKITGFRPRMKCLIKRSHIPLVYRLWTDEASLHWEEEEEEEARDMGSVAHYWMQLLSYIEFVRVPIQKAE